MNTKNGLRQQIANASNITEIDNLLKKCELYKEAEPRTKRQWINTAKKRVKDLDNIEKLSEEKPKKVKKINK
jgi:hypothetical protein